MAITKIPKAPSQVTYRPRTIVRLFAAFIAVMAICFSVPLWKREVLGEHQPNAFVLGGSAFFLLIAFVFLLHAFLSCVHFSNDAIEKRTLWGCTRLPFD